MKFFDLSFPNHPGESSPKVHKIQFEDFRKAYHDMDRSLGERLVEVGFARWASCDVRGQISVPQAMILPMEMFLIILKTGAVKAIHVNALVPSRGPIPNDMTAYGHNLINNMRFSHVPEDVYDADAYDASLEDDFEDFEVEVGVDVHSVVESPPVVKPEAKEKDPKEKK